MRIDFIYGTRPEFIKMAMPIKTFKEYPGFSVRVISTGQHKEMLMAMEDWFGIQPDVNLGVMQPNQSLEELSSRLIDKINQLYLREGHPDILFVQGDTTSAFIAALVGFYKKCRIAHVEAGLRTHNKHSPWPEEMNRVLLSRLADYHFAPTELNKRNLMAEGIREEAIVVTGNTVIDALLYSKRRVAASQVYPGALKEFYNGHLADKRIVLITGHRRENFGKGFESICEAIKELALQHRDTYFIYPVHLNPQVQKPVREILQEALVPNVRLIAPLDYAEFISLMERSYLVLTDSGGVQEEAPGLGKPVLVMRENTERPEALSTGIVKLVGTNKDQIIQTVSALLNNEAVYLSMAKSAHPYGDGNASAMMLKTIQLLES